MPVADNNFQEPTFVKTPPFNPPYMTFEQTPEGLRTTEVLDDGTTRIMPAAEASRLLHAPQQDKDYAGVDKNAPQSVGAFSKPRIRSLAQGDGRAVIYLNVSFAEKDEAKNLGAKWDKAMRKWFLPHGVDINLFRRWWPDELKQEATAFGQL